MINIVIAQGMCVKLGEISTKERNRLGLWIGHTRFSEPHNECLEILHLIRCQRRIVGASFLSSHRFRACALWINYNIKNSIPFCGTGEVAGAKIGGESLERGWWGDARVVFENVDSILRAEQSPKSPTFHIEAHRSLV